MRLRPSRVAVGAIATLLLGAGCTGGAGAPPAAGAPAARSVEALPAPRGLETRVETTRVPRDDGLVDWRTQWVLEWDAVAGADGYSAQFSTSEGGGRQRDIRAPLLRVDAAAGTSAADRVDPDAGAQLAFNKSQLVVRVAATRAGASPGPASDWFPVGEVTPDDATEPGSAPKEPPPTDR